MTHRDELKEKIAEVLRSHSTGIPFVNLSLERAEEIISAIEQSGYEVNQTGTQAELELLEEVCSVYTRDEDRHLKEQGEAYGLIPTECGMKARSAAKRFHDREAMLSSSPFKTGEKEE